LTIGDEIGTCERDLAHNADNDLGKVSESDRQEISCAENQNVLRVDPPQ
jgi:hypothetical protein